MIKFGQSAQIEEEVADLKQLVDVGRREDLIDLDRDDHVLEVYHRVLQNVVSVFRVGVESFTGVLLDFLVSVLPLVFLQWFAVDV